MATSYVEQAILRVQDKSTKEINKVERALDKLFRTAAKGKNIPINFSGIDQALKGLSRMQTELRQMPNRRVRIQTTIGSTLDDVRRVRKAIMGLPTSRSIRLGTTGLTKVQVRNLRDYRDVMRDIQKLGTITVPIKTPGLAKSLKDARALRDVLNGLSGRNVNVNTRMRQQGAAAFSTSNARLPGDTANPAAWGNALAEGFRNNLHPRAIGGNIARGMTYALSGELYQFGRSTVVTAASAPLDIEDSRQLFRATGRSGQETDFVEGIAIELSRQFPGSSAASILASSREVLGSVTGDLRGSEDFVRQALERIARNSTILGGASGLTGEAAAEEARKLEKVIGILGARTDPERAEAISNAVVQGVIASGGDLSVAEAVRTVQQLGAARSDLGIPGLLQALLQRDEAGRRGTGEIRQGYEDFIRGNLNAEDLQRQIDVGLRSADGSLISGDFAESPLFAVRDTIIPLLKEVSGLTDAQLKDANLVRQALDNDLGFSKQGGITSITDFVVNLDDRFAEYNRALNATPGTFVADPTTRQRAGQVRSQFSNFAAQALEGVLPAVEGTLNVLQGSLSDLAAGEGNIVDYAALAATALPVGLTAALQGLADPDTAPLAAAGLSLTGSAGALTAAAGALTGAAAAGSVGALTTPGGATRPGPLRSAVRTAGKYVLPIAAGAVVIEVAGNIQAYADRVALEELQDTSPLKDPNLSFAEAAAAAVEAAKETPPSQAFLDALTENPKVDLVAELTADLDSIEREIASLNMLQEQTGAIQPELSNLIDERALLQEELASLSEMEQAFSEGATKVGEAATVVQESGLGLFSSGDRLVQAATELSSSALAMSAAADRLQAPPAPTIVERETPRLERGLTAPDY